MRRTIRPIDPGIFDYQNHVERLSSRETSLDRLNSIIDWEAFRPHLRRAFKRKGPDRGGRSAFDEVFMLKILVLQRIHDLSEEATEMAVLERLTWHRFLGVHVGWRFPDKNTIWDFKQALIKADIFTRCFEAFFDQIAARGVRLESGKIIDATIVEVPVQRNSREENHVIKSGDVPDEWKKSGNEAKLRQKDVDARWTTKHGHRYFGYKNHAKVDQRTKLIEACVVTPANVHDSQVIFDLVDPDDGRIYADSAYRSQEIRDRLRDMGVQDWTIDRQRRGRPLTARQQETNRTKSRIRARVEHVFGTMVTSLGGTMQRCIGFQRNAAMIIFGNLIYNMHRLRCIRQAS
jgi:transposase, IS5 family